MSIHIVPLSDSRGLGESFRIPFNHLLHICNHWLHLHITVLVECEVIKIFPLHISDRCMMSLFCGKRGCVGRRRALEKRGVGKWLF